MNISLYIHICIYIYVFMYTHIFADLARERCTAYMRITALVLCMATTNQISKNGLAMGCQGKGRK